MGDTICIVCGHRPHAGKCILCFCQDRADAQELARQAVIEARKDEMMRQPAVITVDGETLAVSIGCVPGCPCEQAGS